MLVFRKIWEGTKWMIQWWLISFWNGWLTKMRLWSALPDILTIGNLGHAASKSLTCLKLEFRLNVWSCAVMITTALQVNTPKIHFWACENVRIFIFGFVFGICAGGNFLLQAQQVTYNAPRNPQTENPYYFFILAGASSLFLEYVLLDSWT